MPETKKQLNTLDRSFLALERRDVMMHVGGLLEFTPESDAAPDVLRGLREELSREPHVASPWNLRLAHPDLLASPVQSWITEPSFDVEYHVRRSALPSPGDERELGTLVSRLHGTPLDFHRPPWEVYFIEGLRDGRFAMYVKVHHSLVDGFTAMRLLGQSLSTDASETDTPLFFTRTRSLRPPRDPGGEDSPTLEALLGAARDQIGIAKDVGRAILDAVHSRRVEETHAAPRSVLNQKISRSRRFATQQIALDRIRAVAAAAGGTLNDVVLAICGTALRRFLLEQGSLPDEALVAMLPVNVRPKDDPGGGGSAIGAILSTLATEIEDPRRALEAIIVATQREKARLQGMSKAAIMQYSALLLAPLMLSFVPAAVGLTRPAFNVVISNVPGPETPLYFRGWRLDEMYPLSIPFHGYGLNITVQSYAGSLNFGFTGCRDTLPHLQRLAVYAGDAMDALEAR